MTSRFLIYWNGIIGIPGKGPNWIEPYSPHTTLKNIIDKMSAARLNDRKRIKILKFYGTSNLTNANPYYDDNTTMLEISTYYNNAKDIQLAYAIVK